VHPYRYLAVFLVLLIGAYAFVFLTGNRQAAPKLGIDLQGGTRVTLTARTPDGSKPTPESMKLAKGIIEERVNGLGVSGGEVVTEGDNLLIITVPGNDSSAVRNVGQTARLYIRPVLHSIQAEGQGPQPPGGLGAPGAPPGVPGLPPGVPGEPPPGAPGLPPGVPPAGAPLVDPGAPLAPQPRPYPEEPAPTPQETPSPTPPPAPQETPVPSGESPAPAAPPPPPPGPAQPPAPPKPGADLTQRIADEKALRQSTEQQIQVLAMQFQATRCNDKDVLAGNDDPKLPLVTCGTKDHMVYLLGPSIISGEGIKDASSSLDTQRGEYVVDLEFKGDAATVWADFTAANVGTATAFTLDSQVVSAPTINEAIPGGRTQITGKFTADSARELANQLKYGSLPLSFESSEADTVSATLGLTSLRAGLIAGAIGLALVLLYSLLYYRVLGLLTALSLVASGAMVYAILVLLGRSIGYTLDLAGIAGLIIGIGTTADSFVVFFERIKDEIREGRSFRSAVPRGWVRARKTILSGNAVSFLAAAVLYVLAAGQVKGFAFTLGLTTILDVVVVFFVTWPLVYLCSKSTFLSKPALNGLGAVQQIARERRAATYPLGRR
jgi:preprotein translocase subunit SecD